MLDTYYLWIDPNTHQVYSQRADPWPIFISTTAEATEAAAAEAATTYLPKLRYRRIDFLEQPR